MYDFIIIGAGVVGTHIARELSRYEVKTCSIGMGRCQGRFCGPRVQEIIDREIKK